MSRRETVAVAVAFLVALSFPSGSRAAHLDPSAPNDPLYGLQWALQDWLHVEEAWDASTGAGVTIAVVDSGIDFDHPDLTANVLSGITFLSCGDAGCGNGDWDSGGGTPGPHGTFVGGIAAAVTNNAAGVAGVAPDAKLLPVRVLDAGGGNSADVGRGIKWATDNGADVINLSLGTCIGFTFPCVPATFVGRQEPIVSAIEYAHAAGVVVVAAAGNEMFPLCGHPGYEQGVVCVAATDFAGLPADYSNRPIKPDFMTLSAPGGGTAWLLFCDGGIISTVPAGTGASGGPCSYPADQAYDSATGTSAAAPHVSGVAALLAGLGCTRAEIIYYLTSTAWQPLPYVTEESGNLTIALSQRGVWTPMYGYGIVDAEVAAATAASVCGA